MQAVGVGWACVEEGGIDDCIAEFQNAGAPGAGGLESDVTVANSNNANNSSRSFPLCKIKRVDLMQKSKESLLFFVPGSDLLLENGLKNPSQGFFVEWDPAGKISAQIVAAGSRRPPVRLLSFANFVVPLRPNLVLELASDVFFRINSLNTSL